MEVATQTEVRTGTLITDEILDGKIYSEGWQQTSERLEVHNPATDEHLASVGSAARDDVLKASKLAAEAQAEWAVTPGPERAAILNATAEALENAHEEIEWWLVHEGGGVPQKAAFEVGEAAKELRAAGALTTGPVGEVLPNEQGRLSLAKRLPVGVVGVISPWNFPMILAMRSVAPALALGNAVLLKCDPHTPVCGGLVFARAFEEAGMPENVFQVLPGGVEPGEAICEAPEVRMVSFTGSTRAGRAVGALAGGNLKRVALELGGKSSFIVLDDADIEKASSCGSFGTFFHQGQICMASGRHLVHESVADEYISKLAERAGRLPVGDPGKEEVALGPIINRRQIDRVQELVDDAVSAGADLRVGGKGDPPFFPPTVLANMSRDMRAWNEEIFGPVAPVMTFSSEDEAVEIANDTEYGLSGAVYTSSHERGRELAERLDTGLVHIMDSTVYDDPLAPFGGRGASGNGGRFGGHFSVEEFTEVRWITEQPEPASYPF
ncbi:MAG TPA: benzaldehyde dehydrogenase [Solirubrobacterales bacterium]|jgi:benzaldehyde dehydrogenase (NAD)